MKKGLVLVLVLLLAAHARPQMTFLPARVTGGRSSGGGSYQGCQTGVWGLDENGDLQSIGIWMLDVNGDFQPVSSPLGTEGYWTVNVDGEITTTPIGG